MKKIYTCDICRDTVKNINNLYGIKFSDMWQFSVCGYGSTDGVHICFDCAKQLREQLMSNPISNQLVQYTQEEHTKQKVLKEYQVRTTNKAEFIQHKTTGG